MARTTVSLTIIAIILTVTSIYNGIMATPTTVLGFTDRVVLQTSEILDLLKGLEVEHFEQSNPQIITQASSLGELPLESSSIKFAVAISSSPEFPNDGLLKEILRVLKPDGIVIVQKEASSTIERKLLLAGYLDAQDLQINSTAISGNVSVVKARKPSWKIGSSFSLKKPSKSIPTIQLNDDDDLIDEDSLLTEEDLKKPQLPAVGDCEIGSTKKACKNCMCGKTMDQLNNPQSTCGSCGLGDAFRCGSCPYKGLPPFKMGKKGIMARTTTSITIIAVILTVLLKKFRPKPKPYLVDDVRDELEGSGSSPPFSGYEYDVFLSFRGPDTRKGFTDCLYHALIDAGIRTFRDDESIRTGKEIGTNLIRAIAESKIHIPVLSKDYASTKRCLKELTLIMKFNKERDHMILPVFYDVNPAEVQDQTGDYGRALEKHHEKYGPEVVSSWKETLCKVGHLKGMDLVKLANGYQGQFIKLIVSKVLSELKKSQLVVTEKLIGIDEHVEAIRQLLQFDASDVRIIGIWGMGGIGKTTLAKVIYNQILHSFECYSFIKDVRETSRCNGLPYLQSSLVADLSRREPPPFKSVDEGINELKHMYCQKKVLIVVDDIDDTYQLDALVIKRDLFGPGSRILVTTRKKYILNSVEVDCIYEAQTMSEDNALKLFYKHSLRRDSPTDELSDLSIEIVKSLGWLPLAVEVIGSFLYGKSVLIWKETLKKLRTIPNEKVQDKLLVSFNTLDHEQKQIFLDIACFFIGEDISKMFFMWEDCMFFPEFGIYVLVDYSLVKIVDNNKIWMHDQLRDIGREIVRRESCTNPGMRSRLWHTEDVEDVLTNQMPASSNVEAIRLHPTERSSQDKAIRMLGTSSGEEKHIFTSEQFRKHLNLRFLDLKNVHLAGDIAIPSLRWLRCTHSSVDSSINIHLLNLVTLELVKTNLSHDWNGWASIPMRLKVLNLNGSANLTKTPTFSGFPNLERLTLSHCSKLEVIDSSIGELQNLTYLDINNCDRVRELPYELISLKKLEFLDLSKCGELIGIPSSIIGHLLKLQTLNLRDCRKLETFLALPDHLYNQQVHKYIDLIILDISGCQSVTTLPNLSNLKSLKTLNASNCIKLEGLVGLDKLCSLESLNIRGCSSIERLPDLSKLQKLERFCAYGCYKLQELVGVDEVKSLKKLEITGKNIKLPNLSKLKQLEELSADCCLNLQEIVGFGDLNALKVISLSMCRQLRKLPDLSKLNRLEVLHLFRCEKLQELIGLDQLCSLESLKITYCYSIKRLPDLSNLQKLKVFRARRCYKLQEFVGVDEVKSLKKLQIAKCTEMEKLPNLSKLKQLEELYADGCEKLQEIVGFGDLNALKTINLEMCKQLSKLPDLSKLNCLKALNLLGCEELEELIGLDQLYSLESLNITNCYSIKRLPDLSKLQKLEVFCANNCYKLQELVGVDEVKSLKRLQIRECKEIEKIPNLSKLKHLEELYADYCEKLQEIVGFGDLNALKVISLRMCKQLRKLPDLSKLNHLGALDLFGCKKLQELIGIDQLCSLERLNITNCYSIERLSDLSKLQKLKVFCDDDEEEEEGDDDDV